MLVFKNLTYPFLIGRNILSAHPETKDHFEAIMGKMEDKPQVLNKLHIKPCSHHHKDRSSDDDYDEMDDLKYDNSDDKGCWSKNKTKIDDAISTRVPIKMDRTMCKTRINISIEKRKSTIENIYNCGNDHQCDVNIQQINALDYPTTPATTPVDGLIVIRAIELLLEEAASSLNNTLAEQASKRKESAYTTIQYY